MRKVTTKVDVFSFGVIVMEFLTRRRPTGLSEEAGLPITLPQLVQKALANGTAKLVLDPHLASSDSTKQRVVDELFTLSLSCTSQDPEDRPNMDEVLSSLSKISRMEAQNGNTSDGRKKWDQNSSNAV